MPADLSKLYPPVPSYEELNDGLCAAAQPAPVKRRRSIKETRVIEILRELDDGCRVQDDMQPAEVEKVVKPRYVPRYGEVSRRTIYRAYEKFLKEPRAK
jgi:hypothetical protein